MEKIDLSGLICDQGERVRALIKEESLSFSVNGDDIGNITSHQMEISLNDQTPVQQDYNLRNVV